MRNVISTTLMQIATEWEWKTFISHKKQQIADVDKDDSAGFTQQSIIDEIESDLLDGAMPIRKVESCLIHWRNKYLFTIRGSGDKDEEIKRLKEALKEIYIFEVGDEKYEWLRALVSINQIAKQALNQK